MEAITPVDISMLMLRVEGVVTDQNDTLLLMLDHSEERWHKAQICIVTYQKQIRTAHQKKMKSREFHVGDLVLKCVIQSTWQKDHGKLEPNWVGPYIVIARGGNMSYTLVDQGGNQLTKQWTLSSWSDIMCKSCNV